MTSSGGGGGVRSIFHLARAGAASASVDPPELQPPAEDVGLHGLALLGAEPKLGNQPGRVLQRVAVSQLTWRQEDTVNLQLHI